jgi:hypothetical protein
MIKKNRLGLLVLAISTAVLLSGCSQDAYSGFFSFMGGNVYSEDLGLTLPGESSEGAAVATENATTPTTTTVTLDSNDSGFETSVYADTSIVQELGTGFDGLIDDFVITDTKLYAISGNALKGSGALDKVKDIIDGTPKKVVGYFDSEGNYKVPMFTPSTDEENDELEDLYSTTNAKAKAEISKMLKEEEEDPEKVLAAFNTLTSIENKFKNFENGIVGVGDSVKQAKYQDIFDSLELPIIPESPTKEDLLKIKLMLNVADGLLNALNGGTIPSGSAKGILKASSDGSLDINLSKSLLQTIKTYIIAASINSDIGTLVDKIDLVGIINSLSSTDENEESSELIDDLLNENSAVIKTLLNDYLGIKKDTTDGLYKYNASNSDLASLSQISNLIQISYRIIDLTSDDKNVQEELKGLLSANSKGLDGLITYSLAFFKSSIGKSYTGLRTYYNGKTDPDLDTNKELIDAYLENHSDELDKIFDVTESVDFEDFTKDSAGEDDLIIAVFKAGEDFDSANILYRIFGYNNDKFTGIHGYFDTAMSIIGDDNDLVYDSLSDGLDGLVKLETDYTPPTDTD